MFKFETFSISGDKREGLEGILRFLVETQDFHPTESGYGTLCTQVDGQEKSKGPFDRKSSGAGCF